MTTPLGTSFTDEEVVAQSNANLVGSTVETLVLEFDQAKYEELLSSGSLSPKAMREVRKVSKETKMPIVAVSHSPSSEGVGSASSKLASRVEDLTLATKTHMSGQKRPIAAISSVNTSDAAAKALKQAKKDVAQCRRRSLRRAYLRNDQSSNQCELRVYEPQHEPCVSTPERKPHIDEPKYEPRVIQRKRDPQGSTSNSKRGPLEYVSSFKRSPQWRVVQTKRSPERRGH